MANEKEVNGPAVIKLGGIEIETPQQRRKRLSLLVWGKSGSGKTTLAATAPGRKLWINFDPDGVDVLTDRDDVELLDFAPKPDMIVEQFKEDDPLRITRYLEQHPEIETVVFDSLTTFGNKALSHGILKAQKTAKGKYATIEDPGFAGYGNKNTWTRLAIAKMLKATGTVKRNIIFIAHEDKPLLDKDGNVVSISIMLGSALNEQVPIDFGEVWNLSDTGRERRIAIRNCRFRSPVKSRIFLTNGDPEFEWTYDSIKNEGEGIADWYKEWVEGDGQKINLP